MRWSPLTVQSSQRNKRAAIGPNTTANPSSTTIGTSAALGPPADHHVEHPGVELPQREEFRDRLKPRRSLVEGMNDPDRKAIGRMITLASPDAASAVLLTAPAISPIAMNAVSRRG